MPNIRKKVEDITEVNKVAISLRIFETAQLPYVEVCASVHNVNLFCTSRRAGWPWAPEWKLAIHSSPIVQCPSSILWRIVFENVFVLRAKKCSFFCASLHLYVPWEAIVLITYVRYSLVLITIIRIFNYFANGRVNRARYLLSMSSSFYWVN